MKDKKALLIYLAAFVLMIVAVQCYRPSTDAGPVGVGQEAPRFMLRDISGREVSLDQYKGKIVILDFWQTTCPPCRESMPMLDKIQEDYAGKLSILAINLGEPKNLVRDFILRQSFAGRRLVRRHPVRSRCNSHAGPDRPGRGHSLRLDRIPLDDGCRNKG